MFATESREDRHLMRQRGAGARELKTARFGFSFSTFAPSLPAPGSSQTSGFRQSPKRLSPKQASPVKKISPIKKPQYGDVQTDNTSTENPSIISRKRPAAALDGNNTAVGKSKRRKIVEEPKAAAEAFRSKALLDPASTKAHEEDELEHNVNHNVVVHKKRGRPAKPKTATAATRRGRTTVTNQKPPDTAQEIVHISSGQSEAAGRTLEDVVGSPDIQDADPLNETRNAITVATVQNLGDERLSKPSKPKSVKKKKVTEVVEEEVEEDTPLMAPSRGRRKAEEPKEPQLQIDMEVEALTKPPRRGRKAREPVSEVPADTVDAPPQQDVEAKRKAPKKDSTRVELTTIEAASSAMVAKVSELVTTAIAAGKAPRQKTTNSSNAEVTSAVPLPQRRGRPAKSTKRSGPEAELLVQHEEAMDTHIEESQESVPTIKRLGRPKTKTSSGAGFPPNTALTQLEAPAPYSIEQAEVVHKEIKPRRGRPKKATIAEKVAHIDKVQDKIGTAQKVEQEVEQQADVSAHIQPIRRGRPLVSHLHEQEEVISTQTKPRLGRPTKANIASEPAYEEVIQDKTTETQAAEQEAAIPAEMKPKRRGRPAKASSSLDKPAETTKKQSQSQEHEEPALPTSKIVEAAEATEGIQTAPQYPVVLLGRTQRTKRGRPAKVHIHVQADPGPAVLLQDPPAESAASAGAETSQTVTRAFEPSQAHSVAKVRREHLATKEQFPTPVAIDTVSTEAPFEIETEAQPVPQQSRPQPLTTQSSNVSLSPRKPDEEMRKAHGTRNRKGKVTLPVFRMTATRTRTRGVGGGANDWMKEDWFEPSVPATLLG